MAMSGTRLKSSLATDILSQLQTAFPLPSSLLAGEKTSLQAAQQNLANAIANAAGPDIVTEVQLASVSVTTTGVDPQGGTVASTGTGTVS